VENKPIETTYVIEGDKVRINQVTANVCDQNDLKNVKGTWERQKGNLEKQLTAMKSMKAEIDAIADEKARSFIVRVAVQAGMDIPSDDKFEVLQKQIDNLQKEIDAVTKYIK